MAKHNELGILGEKLAIEYFERQGYTILAKNWTYQKAEIDIIAQKDTKTLVIVEVKTRDNAFIGRPEEFVSKKKMKMLVMAANEFVVSNQLNVEVRFDIIAIIHNSKYQNLEHIENAFYFF